MKDLITDFASVFGLDPEVAVSSLRVFLSNVNDEKNGEGKENEKSAEAGKAASKEESSKQNLNEDPIEGFVRESMELFGLNEQILSDVRNALKRRKIPPNQQKNSSSSSSSNNHNQMLVIPMTLALTQMVQLREKTKNRYHLLKRQKNLKWR